MSSILAGNGTSNEKRLVAEFVEDIRKASSDQAHIAPSSWLIEIMSSESLIASSIQIVPAASYCRVRLKLVVIFWKFMTSRNADNVAPEAALISSGGMSMGDDGTLK